MEIINKKKMISIKYYSFNPIFMFIATDTEKPKWDPRPRPWRLLSDLLQLPEFSGTWSNCYSFSWLRIYYVTL